MLGCVTSPGPMDDLRGLEPSHDEPSYRDNDEKQRKRASLPPRPNAAARHSKRLTLNFPISAYPASAGQPSPTPHVMSPLAQSSAFPSPSRSLTATPSLSEPADEGYMFLTALAAQERKVLELREELQKAEAELVNLKKQWAMGERGRRKTEIVHHAEVMKPLKASADEGAAIGKDNDLTKLALQTRMSRELERKTSVRQSMPHLPAGSASGLSGRPRTVFQSSRHTRTLSLLSPNGVDSLLHMETPTNKLPDSLRGSSHPRSATLPSIDRNEKNNTERAISTARTKTQDERNLWRRSLPVANDGAAEALVRTGKQMASDFKDGLWTFLEDIRQATVGEEGINATESRTMHGGQRASRSARRPGIDTSASRERSTASSTVSRSVSTKKKSTANSTVSNKADVSFWSEFGVDPPASKSQMNKAGGQPGGGKENVEESSFLDVDDNWDVWDTPQPKTHTPSSSSSTFPSSRRDPSPSTRASSPQTSASYTDLKTIGSEDLIETDQSDSIPWPALTKLRPSNLTRTASNLMAEWERSLSPAPSPSPSPCHDAEFNKDLKND